MTNIDQSDDFFSTGGRLLLIITVSKTGSIASIDAGISKCRRNDRDF
jgi:hypothetical protein